MERVYIALDVETTGLKEGVDEIIEIAAVKFSTSTVLETFHTLVKPHYSLPLKTARLTGITPASLADAPTFAQAAPDLVRFIRAYPIIGHSIDFDIRMLQAQGMRFSQPIYDTFELATLLIPGAPGYGLSAIAKLFGIVHRDAHRALADADATRQVFLFLLDRIEALALSDLSEITRRTAHLGWPMCDLFLLAQQKRTVDATTLGNTGGKDQDSPLPQGQATQPPSAYVDSPTASNGRSDRWPPEERGRLNLDSVIALLSSMDQDVPTLVEAPGHTRQIELISAVTQAFNGQRTLLAEVGLGIDRPSAYLVPAACVAACRGERVCIATNTAGLQSRLFDKDIPEIQQRIAMSGWLTSHGCSDHIPAHQPADEPSPPFSVALLKSPDDYLCLQRYSDFRSEIQLSADEIKVLLKIQIWLSTTARGDRAELHLVDKESAAWSRVNVRPDLCSGADCPDYKDCFYLRARRRANQADLTVASQAALFSEPVFWNHLIIDEAHTLEHIATNQATLMFDQVKLDDIFDRLATGPADQPRSGLLADLLASAGDGSGTSHLAVEQITLIDMLVAIVAAIRVACAEWFQALTTFITKKTDLLARHLRVTDAIRSHPGWRDVEQAWTTLAPQLGDLAEGLGMLAALMADQRTSGTPVNSRMILRVRSDQGLIDQAQHLFAQIVAQTDQQLITWVAFDHVGNKLSFNSAPLSVAELLEKTIFAQRCGVVLTSSSLTVNDSFAFIRRQLGVTAADDLRIDAPLDARPPVVVCVPTDMPEPNHPRYQHVLEHTLIELCKAYGGNTLVQFTTITALRQTYRAIQESLEDHRFTVLAQSIDGSRRGLLERFNEDSHTILFGLPNLWEDAHLVADALALVITKLPFTPTNDPVYAARAERYKDPFNEFAVPQAVLRFRQLLAPVLGATSATRVVMVLDSRLLTKPYGRAFLDSLRGITVKSDSVRQLATIIRP